jgi:putative iron-regulated protein
MAISELLYERLSNPFRSRDRKDEESCFSESTRTDLVANARGVENVYLGHYGSVQGPSIGDLIAAKDEKLDARMRQQLAAIRKAVDAIPDPFDHAVLADPSSDENGRVKAAIDASTPFIDTLKAGSTTLAIVNNL